MASLSRWIIDRIDWVWWRLLSGTGGHDYSPFNYTKLITILAESLSDGSQTRGGSDWRPSAGTDKLGILTRNEGSPACKYTIKIILILFFCSQHTSFLFVFTQNILLTKKQLWKLTTNEGKAPQEWSLNFYHFSFPQGHVVLFSSPPLGEALPATWLWTVQFSDWVPEPPLGFTGPPTVFLYNCMCINTFAAFLKN